MRSFIRIIPFGDSQDFISLFHRDLSHPTVCKFIVKRWILLYHDYFDYSYLTVLVSLCLKTLLQC